MVQTLRSLFTGLRGDRRGVTALEYGVIAAAVVLAVAAGVTGLKGDLTTVFTNVTSSVANAGQ